MPWETPKPNRKPPAIPKHPWTPGLPAQPLTPALGRITRLEEFRPCAFILERVAGHNCLLPPDDPVHQ